MSVSQETPSRRERKKLELRREIIDTAFDCFAEQGYHATGIADIAARLGIGHGTFYRYFENKRDIVEHVVDDLFAQIAGILIAENAPDAVDNLDAYRKQSARIGAALAKLFAEDPRVPRLLILDAPGIDHAMAEKILGFLDGATALTAAYLEHGVELGYLRPDLDVTNTSRAINSMILGATMAGLHDDTLDQTALSQAILSMMYDGISADSTQTPNNR